ncbi:MAG TPA: helix-turn-helix domain-containing protein [Candidatus Dormibacteraeota bacterium]|nr:helix-turn-helix domain-containing protein [Candidatus Dormibacteraeota bacterium]
MTPPRGPQPPPIILTPVERQALEALLRQHSTPQQLVLRARIVLACAQELNNAQVARELGVSIDAARLWRRRWLETAPADPEGGPDVAARLQDWPRPGAPGRFTAEQFCQLIAMGCEIPEGSERPISHWTPREMADEAQKRGIVDHISPRHMGRLLKRGI